MKKYFLIRYIIFFLLFSPGLIWAKAHDEVRIAVLDNLRSQKLSSVLYENSYLEGVQAAVLAAKKQGIKIEYKYFKYERGSLDILSKISEIKSWNPDYIIGPRSSDKFILLKPYFTDVIVVSPLASAKIITNMPENFYSFSLQDKYIASAVEKFIKKTFPMQKQMFILSSVDCKSCYEQGNDIIEIYRKTNPSTHIHQQLFFSDKVEEIDLSESVSSFNKGDIFILPNLSYVSGVLIARIVSHLKMSNLVFIGTDGWAGSRVSYVGKIQSSLPFTAYHLSQWPIEIETEQSTKFKNNFHEKFNKEPTEAISFASYSVVMAAVDSFTRAKNDISAREKIFNNFKIVAKKYKSKQYAVYKQDQHGEKLVTVINFQ